MIESGERSFRECDRNAAREESDAGKLLLVQTLFRADSTGYGDGATIEGHGFGLPRSRSMHWFLGQRLAEVIVSTTDSRGASP